MRGKSMSNKCEKCGTEFEGTVCPNCTKEENGSISQSTIESEMQRKTVEEPFWKNKFFIIPSAIALVFAVFMILIFSENGKLQKENIDLQDQLDKAIASNTDLIESDRTLKAEFSEYRKKMAYFDKMSDEEIENLIDEHNRLEEEKKAKEEAAAAEAAKEAAEQKEKQDRLASATTEQRNALSKAKEYLDIMSFSYSGLVEQLKYEGFSNDAATYAAENCEANWNEQAAAKAQEYIDLSSFSRDGLIEQLKYEGFTAEQAEYGVTAVGY